MELNDHILIDDFLNGNLSGTPLDEFNSRMGSNTNFKKEVELQELANLVIVNNERMKIKAQLQQIHNERTSSPSIGKKWWGLGIAIVAVGVLFSIWFVSQNDSNEIVAQDQENKALIKDIIETNPDRNFDVENQEIETSITTEEDSVTVKEAVEVLGLTDGNNEVTAENDPDQTADQPELVKKDKPIILEEKVRPEIIEAKPEITPDPCLGVNEIFPSYQLVQPCFGGKEGQVIFNDVAEKGISFSEFSIDDGKSYHSSLEELIVSIGNYKVVAKNNLGCISKTKSIEVTYADCNFVIQPNYNKLWEIEVPELYDEVTIVIRNAKTGVIVYQKDITAYENFIWQGYDLSNNQLEMGNYVYWFKSATKGVFSKGQITIVK
ncbi:MAG: hypothetical protein P8Q14_09925 [Vicingaceae bacterium]|nr:hypothetical protein [Vicingaceae bacterium]